MELLRARTRPDPRRAARSAALVALLASAVAGVVAPPAQAKKKAPVIKGVSPMDVSVGQKLTIRGTHFLRGRGKNTVVFKRDGARAVFVKADLSTKRLMRVTIPKRLTETMAVRNGQPIPTQYKLRVLARKFGKRYTGVKLSPRVGPELPPLPPRIVVDPKGDCDGDGQINSADVDDDNDLLLDTVEKGLPFKLDPCRADTDGDKVGDGYEFRSARDLNNDEYENLNAFVPYPGKRPYSNPLDPTDAGIDFDGDSLTLGEEHSLWRYTLAHGSAAPTPQSLGQPAAALTYSDGAKYSVYQRPVDDRRTPALSATGYDKEIDFQNWLQASGYWNIHYPDDSTVGLLLDTNRSGGSPSSTRQGGQISSELHYLDTSNNGWLSDDERDEDADGLSNWDETHGRMQSGWWVGRYPRETPFRFTYAGTHVDVADSDGDGVRDGADDQDHDDVPNIVELSRKQATDRDYDAKDLAADAGIDTPERGRVQPFNPCEPFINSRTCPTHIPFDGAWAPFDGPPYSDGDDPNYLVLN